MGIIYYYVSHVDEKTHPDHVMFTAGLAAVPRGSNEGLVRRVPHGGRTNAL
jgi:hypothetical protein